MPMSEHGTHTIKEWMHDLVELARSGKAFEMSAGAEPGRDYAYLEYHLSEGEHCILLFGIESADGQPRIRAFRFEGSSDEVRRKVDEVTHGR